MLTYTLPFYRYLFLEKFEDHPLAPRPPPRDRIKLEEEGLTEGGDTMVILY